MLSTKVQQRYRMELAYRIYHPNHTFFQTGPLCGTVEKDWLCTVYQQIPCWRLVGAKSESRVLAKSWAVTYVRQNYIDWTKSRVEADFVSPWQFIRNAWMMPFGSGNTMLGGIEFETWHPRFSIALAREVSSWAIRRMSLTSAWIISGSNLWLSYWKISLRCCFNEENGSAVTNPTVTGIVWAGLIDEVVKLCPATCLTSPVKHNMAVKRDFIILQINSSSKRPWWIYCSGNVEKVRQNEEIESKKWESRPLQIQGKKATFSRGSQSYAIILKNNNSGRWNQWELFNI